MNVKIKVAKTHPDSAPNDHTKAMQRDYEQSMQAMHEDMMSGVQAADPDVAFVKGMLSHHKGAVAMAEVELKYGKDEAMKNLANTIISAQKREIEQMAKWLADDS